MLDEFFRMRDKEHELDAERGIIIAEFTALKTECLSQENEPEGYSTLIAEYAKAEDAQDKRLSALNQKATTLTTGVGVSITIVGAVGAIAKQGDLHPLAFAGLMLCFAIAVVTWILSALIAFRALRPRALFTPNAFTVDFWRTLPSTDQQRKHLLLGQKSLQLRANDKTIGILGNFIDYSQTLFQVAIIFAGVGIVFTFLVKVAVVLELRAFLPGALVLLKACIVMALCFCSMKLTMWVVYLLVSAVSKGLDLLLKLSSRKLITGEHQAVDNAPSE